MKPSLNINALLSPASTTTKQFIEHEAKKALVKNAFVHYDHDGPAPGASEPQPLATGNACSTYAGLNLGSGSPSTFHILALFRLKFSILVLISNLQ